MSEELKILHLAFNAEGGIGESIKNISSYPGTHTQLYLRTIDAKNSVKTLFTFFFRCLRLIKSTDVLHIHGAWSLHVLPAFWVKGKIIFQPHGSFHPVSLKRSFFKKKIAKLFLIKPLLRKVDKVIALSESEKDCINQFCSIKDKITIIPNGIDLIEIEKEDKAFKREIKEKVSDRFSILYMGRLHQDKGIDILFEGIRLLLDKGYEDLVILIVGDIENKYFYKKLRPMIMKLKLNDHVIFLGYRSGAQKTTLYKSANLLILPSRCEGFPYTIIEAYKYRLPVITTKATPFNEISRLKIGWYTDCASYPLAQAIDEAYSIGIGQLQVMGEQGYNWVLKNYANEIVADLYRKTLQSLISIKF